MKRIVCIAFGLIIFLAIPLAGEAVAPVAPEPDPDPIEVMTAPATSGTLEPIALPGPATTQNPEPGPRYILTDDERIEIEMTVMAEAGGECWEGQVAVAQCILNAAELEGKRPSEILILYRYTPTRLQPSESVRQAVRAVFDRGEELIYQDVLYFYAPARTRSVWHESQEFAIEIGGHRFFRPKGG